MRRRRSLLRLGWIMMLAVFLMMPLRTAAAAAEAKPLIFDDAGLLSSQEYEELSALAREYGAERETDFIIITTDNPDNVDIEILIEDFYDAYAPGYDRPHGNAVILGLDMRNRDVELQGYYKAEEYLDRNRLDKIRRKITDDLSDGEYKKAFEAYIISAHEYMGYEPGFNPDNPLFNIWVQLGGAVLIGGLAVGLMTYRAGGRVTVNRRTYEDVSTSGIIDQEDRYIRTTTTRREIPKNDGGSSGGGVTSGGHSHSSSRGKF